MKDDDVHLRASTNGRRSEDAVNLVTWDALGKFNIAALCEKYKARAPVSWYLTELMAASRKNGVVIVNPLLQAYSTLGDKRPGKTWARLVVIDGLDECQNASVQRYIVRILSTALIHRKLPLFILVVSRPEAPIRDSFNPYDLREMIYTIVLDESYMSDTEIRRFL